MNKDTLLCGLQTHTFAQHLFVYDVTDSSNTQLKERLKKHVLPEGTVLLAVRQTAGRGTGEHHWESKSADSLLFSLVLQSPLTKQPLSFVPAIALVRALRQYAGIDAHLKWPNDVLVGKRKLAGILCEAVKQPNQDVAWVVGVGVNVNQEEFSGAIKHLAISMRQITGKIYSIEGFFQAYMLEMEQLYYSQDDVVTCWLGHTQMIGKTIIATKEAKKRAVKVLGLSGEGYLIVQNAEGQRETWISSSGVKINQGY